MKVEEGKFYRNREGKKIGPMRFDGFIDLFVAAGNAKAWHEDGKLFPLRVSNDPLDLVEEWVDPPPELKDIDQMTLVDYRNGVAAVWNSYRHI
ncbi:hypothetical protein [Methylobacterium indicum]|uniref:Uncharacterized protein n=1 Tax=Methylobacterium indicum TaxID=1775910 RepID=A0A8H9CAG3_9HYPH|nr:hypothetical protein [Methylobacterium indicum]BCM87781.1 hypothetical protein mvi_62420 [Methylobacterium indicum]